MLVDLISVSKRINDSYRYDEDEDEDEDDGDDNPDCFAATFAQAWRNESKHLRLNCSISGLFLKP